jgi:glycosyltransferase involved in cell wall biosynthesis
MNDSRIRLAFVIYGIHKDSGSTNYQMNLLSLFQSQKKIEVIVFAPPNFISKEPIGFSQTALPYSISLFEKIRFYLDNRREFRSIQFLKKLLPSKFCEQIKDQNIDHIYFSSPNPLGLMDLSTPFTTTVWDLGHRDLPKYPEMASTLKYAKREFYFKNVLNRAHSIIVDSTTTKFKLSRYFGVKTAKIAVGGLFPFTETINEEQHLEFQYIIYPANMWPHKNHMKLLEAFAIINKLHPNLHLVLTGGDRGILKNLVLFVKEAGLSEVVHFKGFLPYEDVSALIQKAEVLVMPTLLGPTNLPVLEALIMGTKVAASNIHEPLNDFNTSIIQYFDPYQPEDIAHTVLELLACNPISPYAEYFANQNSINFESILKILKSSTKMSTSE